MSEPTRVGRVVFKDWVCESVPHRYANNGRLALRLIEWQSGEPIATATVNVPDVDIEDDEIIVKDYNENEGMLDALKRVMVIEDVTVPCSVGYAIAHIAVVNDAALERFKKRLGET